MAHTTSGPDNSEPRPSSSIDTSVPSIARVYDYSLGGKDNYAVDQEAYGRLLEVAPNQGAVSWANRNWLIRVVRFLADQAGIDQFLDLGSGLPTMENVHTAAQRCNPNARVVYVDDDPICAAHGRALLEENENTHFLQGDFTKPEELLETEIVQKHLDFERPIALIHCGTLHHVPTEDDPAGIMQRYIDALPAGSYAAITHFWDPAEEDPELSERARQQEDALVRNGLGSGWWRTRKDIAALFGDLEIVDPGLVELHRWWPDGPLLRQVQPEERLILGGVGRKPHG